MKAEEAAPELDRVRVAGGGGHDEAGSEGRGERGEVFILLDGGL